MNGRGVDKDLALGARWYGLAAEQGHVEAQFSLGLAYAAGLGVPLNNTEAVKWLDRAAGSGHSGAAEVLAAIGKETTD